MRNVWNTVVAYNPNLKAAFHRHGRTVLRALAAQLNLNAEQYDIRSNKGGIAVSGEITLHSDSIYVQIYQPAFCGRTDVLIRTCKGRKDYTGGRNHILPATVLNDVRVAANYCRRVLED
jgi:hypothetical protein